MIVRNSINYSNTIPPERAFTDIYMPNTKPDNLVLQASTVITSAQQVYYPSVLTATIEQ